MMCSRLLFCYFLLQSQCLGVLNVLLSDGASPLSTVPQSPHMLPLSTGMDSMKIHGTLHHLLHKADTGRLRASWTG